MPIVRCGKPFTDSEQQGKMDVVAIPGVALEVMVGEISATFKKVEVVTGTSGRLGNSSSELLPSLPEREQK